MWKFNPIKWINNYVHTPDGLAGHLLLIFVLILLITIILFLIYKYKHQKLLISNSTTINQEKLNDNSPWSLHFAVIHFVENNSNNQMPIEMSTIKPLLNQGWEPFAVDNGVLFLRAKTHTESIKLK